MTTTATIVETTCCNIEKLPEKLTDIEEVKHLCFMLKRKAVNMRRLLFFDSGRAKDADAHCCGIWTHSQGNVLNCNTEFYNGIACCKHRFTNDTIISASRDLWRLGIISKELLLDTERICNETGNHAADVHERAIEEYWQHLDSIAKQHEVKVKMQTRQKSFIEPFLERTRLIYDLSVEVVEELESALG